MNHQVERTTSQTFRRYARLGLLALFVAAGMLMPLAAQAGTITAAAAIVGPGLGTGFVPIVVTPDEGNDNTASETNLAVVVKRFDQGGYIDIEFVVRDSDPGGTTEYFFFESVDNNTGVDWSAYTMELGFNFGDDFVPSPADDGLDFDYDDFDAPPTSAAFPNVALGQDVLVFSGGIHSTGSEIYRIRIDVPDGITTFTLRQYPTLVPEPSSLALAGGALLGLAAIWRRRRKS